MSEAMESSLIPEETPAEEIPIAKTPAEDIPEVEPAPEQPVEEAAAEPQAQPEVPVMPAPATPQKIKKIKRSRPWPLKILLELVAIILCLTLFVVTIAGALIVDLRVMTSENGLEKILTELVTSTISQPGNSAQAPVPNGSVTLLSNVSEVSNPITDMVYDMLKDQFGQDLPLSKEEVSNFINNSTVKDFMAEKVSGAIDDFINETNNTTITKDEIMDLVKDNAPLIKESFGVEITDDQIKELETALDEIPILEELEQDGLMGFIEDSLLDADGNNGGSAGMGALANGMATVKQIMEYVRLAISNTAIGCIAGVLVFLMLLVLLVNWSLPKTLSDIGITLLFAGLILSSVNFVAASGVLQIILADQAAVIGMLTGILSSIAVVHYSILGAGVALILLAIVAKIIKNHRRKALQAAI